MASSILRRFSAWLVLHVGEFDLGQLGDAVHQQGHIGAEFLH